MFNAPARAFTIENIRMLVCKIVKVLVGAFSVKLCEGSLQLYWTLGISSCQDTTLQHIGTGLVGAPACGDVMKLQIKVNVETNIIEDAVFKTFGCGSAIASSSYASEVIKNMSIDEAKNLTNKAIAQHLKLPPVKLHCSMLAEDAIKAAVNDYKSKNTKND